MKIRNVHERRIAATREEVGALLDQLAGENDPVWSARGWPRLRLDRGLTPGSRGGHGPIRYEVTSFTPGESLVFRFTEDNKGFSGGLAGFHRFDVEPVTHGSTILRHTLEITAGLLMRWKWRLAIAPLHDALIEDLLDNTENRLTGKVMTSRWSLHVRLLRRLVRR